jgi:DNA-directed RNA polymerase subunit H (RpoH/RPB5)
MLVFTKTGDVVEINRKDFLNDTDYYCEIVALKFGKNALDKITNNNSVSATINKNHLVSIIKKTTYT